MEAESVFGLLDRTPRTHRQSYDIADKIPLMRPPPGTTHPFTCLRAATSSLVESEHRRVAKFKGEYIHAIHLALKGELRIDLLAPGSTLSSVCSVLAD